MPRITLAPLCKLALLCHLTTPVLLPVISLAAPATKANTSKSNAAKANESEKKGSAMVGMNFEKGITTITSKQLVLKSAERKFVYTGAVEVLKDDMTLKCDILEGNYGQDNKITDLVAKSNVFITQGEGTKAKGNRAVYNKKNETVTLTENPEIEQNGSILSADKITLFIKEDRSTAEGTVKVKLVEGAEGKDKTSLKSALK
jgi:lipopolysaccharide transport protein LptA